MSTDVQVDATTESLHVSTAPRADGGLTTACENGTSTQARNTVCPAAPPFNDWPRRVHRRLIISDFLVVSWFVFGTQIAWFGFGNAQPSIRDDARTTDVSYWVFSVILILGGMGAVFWSDSRSTRILDSGLNEYLRVVDSSVLLFGVIAIVAFLSRVDVARGFLILSLPIGIAVLLAMSIRLSSDRPVLFRQVRIGRGDRVVTMLKFRSTVINAEDMLEQLWRERQRQGVVSGNEVMFKMKNDPHVTPIGRIMRKFSLDELPQLFMSSVGRCRSSGLDLRFPARPSSTPGASIVGSWLSWESPVCGRAAASRHSPGRTRSISISRTSRMGRSWATS